ncbi:hypothetical protein AK830_g2865 [Neonectria ditissima]|uniref:Xylanolytic transcriptional activator regulatory domain-containing protein n=1 Tax=Neonectria ditissima TaxID=78410 RepID=A0A0P7BA21_9HYPO|nr:hypothetical protein AK830_g2865 [Neonectria ditissima]
MLALTNPFAAALALLGTAAAVDAYVPAHKRFTYDVAINDFSYLGILSKRDKCSDAFGSNAHNSNCAPDFTLCCTRDSQDYPSCEKWLSKGWCCVGKCVCFVTWGFGSVADRASSGDSDKCYVDQASACDEDSSVSCTNLQEGTAAACCPKLTTCDESVPGSSEFVRCNINRGDLLVAHAAKNGKSSVTEEDSTRSTEEASTSTESEAAQTTEPKAETTSATAVPDRKTRISGGAIGGIVVGAVVGIAGICGVLFWFFRRREKKVTYEATNQSPQPPIPQYYQDQQGKYQQQPEQQQQQQQQSEYYQTTLPNQHDGSMYPQQQQQQPAELMDHRPLAELDSSRWRVQIADMLATTNPARAYLWGKLMECATGFRRSGSDPPLNDLPSVAISKHPSMDSPAAIRRRRRRRVADQNRKRAPRAEKSPRDGQEARPSVGAGDQVIPAHPVTTPQENITIDSHQTEWILWPRFLSRLREAFSLDSQTAPEEQDMVAMQAHITRPTILQPAELSRLRSAMDTFPPRPVADFLLSVCMKRATDIFFYFDQAQFLTDIHQYYTDPASHLRSDSSFVCLAMAAFALGSHWTQLERPDGSSPGSRPEDGDPGRVFYSQAKALIPDIIDRPCLRSIQAPFVLGVYLMPASAIGSSYVYMGLALRKALAFDLHQNSDDQNIDEREREVRRRLWWSIYSLERCTTVKLNRPRSISVDIVTAPLPSPLASLDRAQTFDNVQLQIAYVRLIKILDQVAEPGDWLTDAAKPTRSASAEADLRQWKKSLPREFRLENIHPKDSSYRAVFHLYLNYYYSWIAMGKVSLVTVARAKLRYHLGPEAQKPQIDETVDQLSKSCAKAARKVLQLFENLTRTKNMTRFSFTDFQGCSIAIIVTLVAGILERDSAYEARVAFGLDCLRNMATGNMTAKMGVRFVEALQSITNEAIQKLNQAASFMDSPRDAEESTSSEYNQWAEWLAKQDLTQRSNQEQSCGEHLTTDSMVSTQQAETWSLPQPSVAGLAGWGSAGRELLTPAPLVSGVVQQESTLSRQTPASDSEFLSVMYNDEQTFLMGLTGLDVLDFSGFAA